MAQISSLLCILALISCVFGTVYFQESFGADWEDRWVQSKSKDSYGKFKLTAGKWFNNRQADKGIQTSEDAKFYAISSKFPESFSNEDKTLVVQFTVKHEQELDCGGGYLKLFGGDVDLENFHGGEDETQYNIMFGPDICGYAMKKIHLIFRYNGKNHLWKKEPKAESDRLTHLYTLILNADSTYQVNVDGKKIESGNLADDWDLLEAKEIKDPEQKKPKDWVNAKEIDDPEDTKPEDWDNEPAQIADPDASQPDDWDTALDGDWEAPMIDNPKFKGDWKAKRIPNPEYKGEWVHPMIANPNYKEDKNLYRYENFGGVGIDIWQVKSGSIFDNILVTDDVDVANAWAEKELKELQEGEKKMFDVEEDKRRAKEEEQRKADEEKRKADKANAGDDEDMGEEDEYGDHYGHDHSDL